MTAPSQYLTVNELLNAPLGLDLRNTPAAGNTGPAGVSAAQWYAALLDLIYRASASVDNYLQQTLNATVETEELWTDGRRAGIDQNGYLWLQLANFPVISVSSFQYGFPAIGGTSWSVPTLSDVLVTGPQSERLVYPGGFYRRGLPPLRVQTTYLAGYPNTLLTGSTKVSAGSTTLPVADLTGFVAGGRVTIYDGGATETVTVSSTFTAATGAGNLTLASGTLFDHTPTQRTAAVAPNQAYDIAVSALPPDVKRALHLICKEEMETRGATALVMGRAGSGVTGRQEKPADPCAIPKAAADILQSYQRII